MLSFLPSFNLLISPVRAQFFSSLFGKLERVSVNFECDPAPHLHASAVISENGYEAVPVQFVLRPRTREAPIPPSRRGSCFELLKNLVRNPQTGNTISPESLRNILNRYSPASISSSVFIIYRNTQLAQDLKQNPPNHFSESQILSFQAHEIELLVSLEEGGSHFEIPTFDFAIARQDEILYICTASEGHNERIFLFFQISNYPPILEQFLRVFMTRPSSNSSPAAFSLPILPSIDTDSLVIQPASVFESFMEESASDDFEMSENNENNNTETSEPKHRPITSKPKRSESSATAKPASIHHRKCLNCFCISTPMWRRGPDGTASLCNACGVKFKAGKLQLTPETIEENMKKVREYAELMMQQRTV